jgi:hypothetical protein
VTLCSRARDRSGGEVDIDDALQIAGSGGSEAIRRYGIYADGWSFHSKATIIQLQAPDIWAYENYWYAVDRSDDVTQSIVVTQ